MREKTENGFYPGHYKAKVARLVLTELLVKKLTTTTKCGASELLKPKQKFTECINDLREKKKVELKKY